MAQRFHSFAEAKEKGIEYSLLVGRRQPMHQAHFKTIRKNMDQGLVPIIVIGSSNTAIKQNGFDDELFDPIKNPLTLKQQQEQIRRVLHDKTEGKDYVIMEFKDLGNNELWCHGLVNKLHGEVEINGKNPELIGKTMFHFIGKPEDKVQLGEGPAKLEYAWEKIFDKLNFPALVDKPHPDVDITLSATHLRGLDLNHLSKRDRDLFADPDYIIKIANKARAENPSKPALDAANIPVTLLDLSLERLEQEKHISTSRIINALEGKALTLDSLRSKAAELNKNVKTKKTVPLKIASASCNQTAYNYATNLNNILSAIDTAAKDKADILALEEMGLVGYGADDYHQWNKNNDTVWKMVQLVAKYAKKNAPNLVVSLGAPWHYADKNFPADDPQYNINNRPFNTQMTIAGGEVVAISAKSILADGAAEYEPRQFNAWPVSKGTIDIVLPNGKKVPFGKPVVGLESGGKHITLFHEICAEGWPGVGDDLSVNNREKNQVRYLAKKSNDTDLSVVLNPSASKPQPSINKEEIRAKGLCESGAQHCGAYVYTNSLGSNAGTMAMEGSQIFAQNNRILHKGKRYNFKNMSYSSAVMEVPLAERNYKPNVEIHHNFNPDIKLAETTGGPAEFEQRGSADRAHLMHEEYARSVSLWLRDYMRKQPWCQGYVISLSGGKDSAYGAVAVANMVELEVKENGVKGFFDNFPNLKYKNDVIKVEAEQGEKAAIAAIKKNLLTCVYMPTDNSSKRTENAARFLIEGGEVDGKSVMGIGGSFYIASQQKTLDEAIISYAGLDVEKLAQNKKGAILKTLNLPDLPEQYQQSIAEAEIRRIVKNYVNADANSNPKLPDYIKDSCVQEMPTWADPKFDIALQNFQARVRVSTPWALGNTQSKIALVTSNASEADLGYSTAGGDMHMGGANPIGGIPKDDLTKGLLYLQEHGLAGLHPVEALHYINKEKPTAELRKETGITAAQTDEKDLGFSYTQGNIMRDNLIIGRKTIKETFVHLQKNKQFPNDSIELRNILLKFTKRWEDAQFKRTASTLSPHLGNNVDPHNSVRTHEIGDHFRTQMAELTLDVLSEKLGRHGFQAKAGMNLETARLMAQTHEEFKQSLLSPDFDSILKDIKEISAKPKKSPVYQLTQGLNRSAL
jgi:NH3-dependent NAD+ synthetase/predicted amidohydrolase/nicotinamide mononucleotide adenylyltransferase